MLLALYAVTIANVLISAAFAIAGVVRPGLVRAGDPSPQSRTFALYAAARAVTLALFVLLAAGLGATPLVFWLGAVAGLVQVFDAAIGWIDRAPLRTLGPLVIAIVQLAVLFLAHQAAADAYVAGTTISTAAHFSV